MLKKTLFIVGIAVLVCMLIPTVWLIKVYITYGNLDANTVLNILIGSAPQTHYSPNGQYHFITEVWRRKDKKKDAYLCVLIRINDNTGSFMQEINTHASDFHRWEAAWKNNETIVIKSSDIGDFEYTRARSGRWVKNWAVQ